MHSVITLSVMAAFLVKDRPIQQPELMTALLQHLLLEIASKMEQIVILKLRKRNKKEKKRFCVSLAAFVDLELQQLD